MLQNKSNKNTHFNETEYKVACLMKLFHNPNEYMNKSTQKETQKDAY